ncbi:SDR family NAD(P)-dependent oxidoreductase [Actinosynnema sp. NPDC047251]|uniref:Short-chain dehydrogenase/reductase n=1 Tax=Saccharothrix espanaensis (strain ATCC 51144 / DSM 44229 / JCM 9112 / NBRC 15066 / NRRL 15764) TaxID=1179773 RepID=K0JZ34_SACES|nr:SDR family NAD(P)-dependent oxidoreductase [Saccharothrix espanaensis]CCH31391.1 Short-chain dehydrogenase/reductase [Saccharothrix espanaensis DSM 44229]
MTKTYVITGATDGIGAAVARELFTRGDHVVALGTNPAKGAALVRAAEGAPGTVEFVQADLSLVATSRRVVASILRDHPRVDGLVLCARHFRSYRSVTAEGFEDNFALFYLSRLLFGYGLRPALERADRPVIVNVAGPGHDTPVTWDDLQSARDYDGVRAMFLSGRLDDLLGVEFARRHGDGPVRYVLFHPGTTATGFVGEFDPATAAFVEQQKALAKPATEVVPPIVRLLDDPPAAPLTAYTMYRELPLTGGLFSPADARRLAEITGQLLDAVRG